MWVHGYKKRVSAWLGEWAPIGVSGFEAKKCGRVKLFVDLCLVRG